MAQEGVLVVEPSGDGLVRGAGNTLEAPGQDGRRIAECGPFELVSEVVSLWEGKGEVGGDLL